MTAQTTPADWDAQAVAFDEAPDHGLRDARVRSAWRARLQAWIGPAAARVLDLGCGTGSLSLLLAELGHRVTRADFSPAMLRQAQAKAARAGVAVAWQVMDARQPALAPGALEVVLCRHLVWALPDPAEALRCWARLLARPGRLIMIEGLWQTGAGLSARELTALLPEALRMKARVEALGPHAELWGHAVTDERYVIIAEQA